MQRGRKRNRQLDTLVGIPLLNLLASFRRRRKPPLGAPTRIGLLCSPALGDTLLFSSVLQDLRASYPTAYILHFCMKQNLAAAEIIPGANERVMISLTSPLATLRTLRAARCDVLFDFTSWQRLTAFYTMCAGANYTVGFATAGQRRGRGYDRAVEHRSDRHEIENLRALVSGSGLQPAAHISHAPMVCVEPVADPPFAEEPDVVALHLWASGQRSWLREWPEARWVALAQNLAGAHTLFVVTGAPSDAMRMHPFVELLRATGLRAVGFVSPDGFRSLTGLLRRARVVVSVNTGVMHLAAVAGARLVAINGPNSNGRWGPVGPHAIGVEAPGEGCGFLHLGFNFDGNPTDCMERTSVGDVFAACMQMGVAMPLEAAGEQAGAA